MSDGSDFQVCGVSSVCRAYKHCYTLLWSELCCVRTVTVIPCCDLSSAVYALSYRAVIWALLCTHCHTVLWPVCACTLSVVEKAESREHCEAERSRSREQQALLCVRIHERKSVSDDKGQVGFILLIHSCFCVPCWEPCQPQPLWGLLKPQPTRTHSAYHRIQNMVQSSGRRPLAVFWS